MTDRLLVAGASGLVGTHVVEAARGQYEVLGVARHLEGQATGVMDLADERSIANTLEQFPASVIVVGSAFAWVDGCERDPERSERENVGTLRTLCKVAPAETRLVFYSTDHVFDGRQPRYVESDKVNPGSVYARHKREAEELLLARGNSLIARTSYVFGREARKKNFLYRVLEASGTTLKVPERQAGMPTWAGWLAEATVTLLGRRTTGVVHLVGPEVLTKAQWALRLAQGLGVEGVNVVETSWNEAGQVAPRPERVVLASERHHLVHPALSSTLSSLRATLASP